MKYEVSYMLQGKLVTTVEYTKDAAVVAVTAALMTYDAGTSMLVLEYDEPRTITCEILTRAARNVEIFNA